MLWQARSSVMTSSEKPAQQDRVHRQQEHLGEGATPAVTCRNKETSFDGPLVDVNKGDELEPNCKYRCVACQLKAIEKSEATYFAPEPLWEAFRIALSLARTRFGTHHPIWAKNLHQRMQLC